MKPVFVDTSGWLTTVDHRDKAHKPASAWMHENRGWRLVTTTFVLDETLTLIRRRLGHRTAMQFGDTSFKSKVAKWCRSLQRT